jgi:hypothetical protein
MSPIKGSGSVERYLSINSAYLLSICEDYRMKTNNPSIQQASHAGYVKEGEMDGVAQKTHESTKGATRRVIRKAPPPPPPPPVDNNVGPKDDGVTKVKLEVAWQYEKN